MLWLGDGQVRRSPCSEPMPRARASEENRQIALEFACCVTTSEQADDSFVARRGPYSIYNVLRECLPGVIRDDKASHSNRKGVSEAEFLRSLSESGKFERYRDRKAVKRSEDPSGAGMCLVKAHRWRNPALMSDLIYLRTQHQHLSQVHPEFAKLSLETLCCCLSKVIASWSAHGAGATPARSIDWPLDKEDPAAAGGMGCKRQREEAAVASALLELQDSAFSSARRDDCSSASCNTEEGQVRHAPEERAVPEGPDKKAAPEIDVTHAGNVAAGQVDSGFSCAVAISALLQLSATGLGHDIAGQPPPGAPIVINKPKAQHHMSQGMIDQLKTLESMRVWAVDSSSCSAGCSDNATTCDAKRAPREVS